MRLSKSQGEARAIRLASAYLAERIGGVWQCHCTSIDLDSVTGNGNASEINRRFSIAVNCVQENSTGEKQIFLLVDIARQSVTEL